MRVLIADDDAMTRRILQRSVEVCGHTCQVARDGLEAWDLFGQAGGDVIISDWLMPGIDGVELCRRVRASPSRVVPYTYVIFLTALGAREHMRAAMEVGADDYLAKPLNHEDLRVRLGVADRVTAVYRRLAAQQVELERSNAERLRQEGHFRALIQHAADIIAVVDPAGAIRYLSPTVERLLGHDATALVGSDLFALVHPDDHARAWAAR